MSDLPVITAGFLPLTDALLLIAAHELGFAAAEGFALRLVRETSWANIRDRLGVGHFDVTHMLAPMPIAANLGLNPLPTRFIAPMTLGHGGNAVTVSTALWAAMAAEGAVNDLAPGPAGAALARVVRKSARRLRFGAVHQNSSHNYELRYWLAASAILPGGDVEIVILPPPLLADALAAGAVDGYCVGEPWNSVGVELGAGRIVATKSAIWRSSPDKVLGVRETWADEHPELLAALMRALHRAALWCSAAENRDEAARILALPHYLDQPAGLTLRPLSGDLALGGGTTRQVERFYVPYAGAANFPWQTHALWFYTQMVRWGDVTHSAAGAYVAAQSFRPDLYRQVLAPLHVPLPASDTKIDGEIMSPIRTATPNGPLTLFPDGFFDAVPFDPDAIEAYIASQTSKV